MHYKTHISHHIQNWNLRFNFHKILRPFPCDFSLWTFNMSQIFCQVCLHLWNILGINLLQSYTSTAKLGLLCSHDLLSYRTLYRPWALAGPALVRSFTSSSLINRIISALALDTASSDVDSMARNSLRSPSGGFLPWNLYDDYSTVNICTNPI